ncbi:polysaccharide deacetylase family protein [Bacilliculturomica massiliensis]|uniref:polysaccharide deacetylase family protein n=1 Tax=Bacilliculturomica massiliensis TaxID=1917867 RepID=UPI00102FFA57|nr:polysaccharide deacetylase [Bacilliculturomica massiliensis]
MYMQTVKWPEGRKCAAMVTVNLDAEFFWLELDPACVNMPKTLSMGQYGMTRGLGRLLEAFEKRGIKATFFVPGKTAELYGEQMREIAAAGHEIACRGYACENLALLPPEEQRELIARGAQAVEKSCGVKPAGFRAPNGEITLETLRIVRDLGMSYSSCLSDDDRPYYKDLGDGRLLEIPAHWAMYDLPYFAFNYNPAFPAGQGRIANYSGVLSNWKDEFYGYHRCGLCYVLQLDPQTAGNPGRIGIVEELLDYMEELGGTWFATGSQMLDWFGSGEN